MANTSFNFNIEPYYDDFAVASGPKEQNYMRVMFRPGYAVQARELTQIQSIIQNQIKSFGDHIFQDGSPVQGGHITLDSTVKSLKLNKQQNGVDVSLSNFDGQMITDDTAGTVNAKVVAIQQPDDINYYPTILIKYLSSDEFNAGDIANSASTVATATVVNDPLIAAANGSIAGINEGIFYVDGFFVYVEPQTIVLDAYSNTPTFKVGLQIVDGIVDESQDSSLLDPAQNSFNYQAPGATRYQFKLELTKRLLDSIDDSRFFELLRVENGIITKQVDYPIYADLEKTLARRTYDESGDYTVKPFRATVSEANTSNPDKFIINIEPGKAYVRGHEFETKGTVSFSVDKARSTNTSTKYNFSLDYGNYVVVDNLFAGATEGLFDISSFTTVDLHCVPSANIVTTSSTVYDKTLVGTAKVRNLDYASGTDYYAYLLDISTLPVTGNAGLTSPNTSSFYFPSGWSTVDGAYVGVKFKSIGTGADDYIRTITSYNSSSLATVDIPFNAIPDTSTQFTLIFDITNVNSIVTKPASFTGPVYGTQVGIGVPVDASMDISSVTGKSVDGKTTLFDTNKGRLVFPLPESQITASPAFSDIEFYKKIYIGALSSVGGVLTINLTGSDNWFFGTGTLSSLVAKSNFIVTNRSSTGQVLDLGSSVVTQVSPTQVTITVPVDALYSIIATVKAVNEGSGSKTLTGNGSAVLTSGDSSALGVAVKFDGGVDVVNKSVVIKTPDANTAQVWFRSQVKASDGSRLVANTPSVPQSLYLTDVVKIVKVYDSGNTSWEPNTVNAIDITKRYILNGGQKDSYYDYATVTLKDGYAPPTGQTVFLLQYYQSTSGYYTASSYDSYEKIPFYSSSTGKFSLRDAVDFRPIRTNANTSNVNTTVAFETATIPSPEFSFQSTYSYYVPRIDKLVLSRDKEFKVVQGLPSVNPVEPKVSDDVMLLYTLNIPAYTANVADIGIKYNENKRYTMRDIGTLEKRIENLEYYTSLNVLEQQAKNQTVLYEDNVLEKEKYGIVADDFQDFSVADKYSGDLVCNISKASLGPYKVNTPVKLEYKPETGLNVQKNDRTISLGYSETPCVVQNTATKAISVQPYQFAQFHGSASLYPETDYWYSQKLMPEVISPGTDFIKVELPPAPPPIVPAPDIMPEIVVVEPPPVVGIPVYPTPEPAPTPTPAVTVIVEPTVVPDPPLTSDGFGAIDVNMNWYGYSWAMAGQFASNYIGMNPTAFYTAYGGNGYTY